jgi:predicted SprT family Zn-dependent metalloprotease
VVRHEYKCPNGCDEYKLSTRMHNSIRRGNHRICKKCKTRVVYSGRSGKDL